MQALYDDVIAVNARWIRIQPDMANYELLVPNFSLNSTMDRQLNYNYNFLNFQNYQPVSYTHLTLPTSDLV